jgi:hypothetical protein
MTRKTYQKPPKIPRLRVVSIGSGHGNVNNRPVVRRNKLFALPCCAQSRTKRKDFFRRPRAASV